MVRRVPKTNMDIFLRVAHTLFVVGVIATYGWEALRQGLVLQIALVTLGVAGLSQTYWKVQVNKNLERRKADVTAFSIGIVAIVAYIALCIRAMLAGS